MLYNLYYCVPCVQVHCKAALLLLRGILPMSRLGLCTVFQLRVATRRPLTVSTAMGATLWCGIYLCLSGCAGGHPTSWMFSKNRKEKWKVLNSKSSLYNITIRHLTYNAMRKFYTQFSGEHECTHVRNWYLLLICRNDRMCELQSGFVLEIVCTQIMSRRTNEVLI